MSSSAPRDPDRETLDREIDENLRRAFDDIAAEPMPDRFAKLLDQLKTVGAESADAPGACAAPAGAAPAEPAPVQRASGEHDDGL